MALSASLNPEGVSSARTVASSCGSASRASVDASSTIPGEGTIAPPPEASSYSARCTSRFRSADVTRRRPSPRSSQRSAIHVSGVSTRTPSPQGPPASASRTRKTAADEGTRSTGDPPAARLSASTSCAASSAASALSNMRCPMGMAPLYPASACPAGQGERQNGKTTCKGADALQ